MSYPESIGSRPTSLMFGDMMLSDHHNTENSWGYFKTQRSASIYFWYWFRTTLPFTWPLLFVGTFLIPYFCFDHSDGYIFIGSILSAVFCVLAFLSYWQIRPWRRHPSILIIMICFISIVISCILVFNAAPHGGDQEIDKSDVNVIQDSHFSLSDRSASCLLMSFFIQLTLLARESWILTLSLDLLTSITNPFASYKSSLQKYHFYIWSFTILSAIILISTKSCQGEFLSNGTCWIRISGAESVCFWGFFMAWVIMFYINAAAVLAYAFSRVSKGLESTYATRYACVADTFRVVFLYFIYGMIIAVLFLTIYYSYKSGIPKNELYFLEHCFAYLIACRGFIDSLIWFFSHGFVNEKGRVTTNLAVVVCSNNVQKRKSRRLTPSKPFMNNRVPFSSTMSQSSRLTEVMADEEEIEEDSTPRVSNNSKRNSHLLTLSDVFMPDQSLRSLFSTVFFGKPSRMTETGNEDEDMTVSASRQLSKKYSSWQNISINTPNHLFTGDSNATHENSSLAEALLSPVDEEMKGETANVDKDNDEDDDDSGTNRTRDTYDVDVSPQLNLALRKEVLNLVTRGIQESVTRMIDRDRQLRYQLAQIGVTVLDERDYFQDVMEEEDEEDYESDQYEYSESESDAQYLEGESSEGYESSSSVENYDPRKSDSSIHSLLSSQHSSHSIGILPTPAGMLPSSMHAGRRVVPIQRTRPRAERKSDNKGNRLSNTSASKSKHARNTDSKGRQSRSRGKQSGHAAEEKIKSSSQQEADSPFADLTAAHRAGVAPEVAVLSTPASTPESDTNPANGPSIVRPRAPSSTKSTSTHESLMFHNRTEKIQRTESPKLSDTNRLSRIHHHRGHHNSHHIPSNIYLTNVNHSFHFRPNATDGADSNNKESVSSSTSRSGSYSLSPLHLQHKSASSSFVHHPCETHTDARNSPSQEKHKQICSSVSSDRAQPSVHHPIHHSNNSSNLPSHPIVRAQVPIAPVHVDNNVIQNLMSIVTGQYYPGEYGVDNLEPTTIVHNTAEHSSSHYHKHHHHYSNNHSRHSMAPGSYVTSSKKSQQSHKTGRMSMGNPSTSSMSFRFPQPLTRPSIVTGLYASNLHSEESSSKKNNRKSLATKMSYAVGTDEELGGPVDNHEDYSEINRENSLDSLDSKASQYSSVSSQSTASSASSTSSNSNASLRQKKQNILNEFRPPAIVVFYFDQQRHRFRDFRPATFRQLRSLAGISEEDYLRFICQPTQERLSEGRSGAFFFICGAGELVVKTIARNEATTLLKILDQYRAHFVNNPESLIVRFLGLHSIALYGTEFYFVVMKNIFPPGQRLQERYDLKGSYIARHTKAANRPGSIATCRHCGAMFVVGDPGQGMHTSDSIFGNGGGDRRSSQSRARRSSGSQNKHGGVLEAGSVCPEMAGGHEPSVTLKDNDLTSKIRLHPEHALQVIDTLFSDSDALAAMGLMDYSVLVGVQHVHYDLQESQAMNNNNQLSSAVSSYRSYPARVVIAPNQYYFGIIDILQTWDYTKKFENFVKVNILGHPYDGISAIPPQEFKRRFQRKIASVIDHAALIREVTGSWQGKREVGNVYSLTSLPPNMSVIPSNWTANNHNNKEEHQRKDGKHQSLSNAGDGMTGVEEDNKTEYKECEYDSDADMEELTGRGSSMSLRESITSRHSLVISADQGANALDYLPLVEGSTAISPMSALRHVIADRHNSFREKSFN